MRFQFPHQCRDPLLELLQFLHSTERFIEAKPSENHIGFLRHEMLIQSSKILWSRHQVHLICCPGEGTNHQSKIRMAFLQHRLEIRKLRPPVKQGVAYEHHMIILFQHQR